MKQRYAFFAIGLVLIGLLFASAYRFRTTLFPSPKPAAVKVFKEGPQTISASLQIDYAGKLASSSAELTANRNETALQLLERTHAVETKHYDFGDLVQKIDGIEDGARGFYWIYYVNGQSAKVGASQYQLQSGDTIFWRLEKEKP